MIGCCNLSYVKYINEDGTPDVEALRKIANERKQQGKKMPPPKELCRCNCHIKGSTIIH